jgi:response regulator RpfG family c-di-GMP phosphodiesterase
MDHLFQQGFDIILIETHIPHQDTYAFVQQMTSLLKIPVISKYFFLKFYA